MTIDAAMSLLRGYLDRVAADAESYMKSYIRENANQGYATGALADSIDTRKISEIAVGIGSSLRSRTSGKVYGQFVDKGRGPITKTDGFLQYYDPKLGRWVKTHHVQGMAGIGFIEATADHVRHTHIGLS